MTYIGAPWLSAPFCMLATLHNSLHRMPTFVTRLHVSCFTTLKLLPGYRGSRHDAQMLTLFFCFFFMIATSGVVVWQVTMAILI